jgi:hypothetical protein
MQAIEALEISGYSAKRQIYSHDISIVGKLSRPHLISSPVLSIVTG